MSERMLKDARGQTLVEVLVAVPVISLFIVGALALATVTFRLLVGSGQTVTALGLLNERAEYVRSLVYEDVGCVGGTPEGVLGDCTLTEVRGNQTFTVETAIYPETAPEGKRVVLTARWTPDAGTPRDVRLVLLQAPQPVPHGCSSCSSVRTCDRLRGVCISEAEPPPLAALTGTECVVGMYCPWDIGSGGLCPVQGTCPGEAEPASGWPPGAACAPGTLCRNGAVCPLSGVCPTEVCPAGVCSAGNSCFLGYCYPLDWYDLTFVEDDASGPAFRPPLQCQAGVVPVSCVTSADCPQACAADDGSVHFIWQCEETWVPRCQVPGRGGAATASGNGLTCQPVPCPASGECPNRAECGTASSNQSCSVDSDCPIGETCETGSGQCREICAQDASCRPYWGGMARACRAYPVPGAAVSGLPPCRFDAAGLVTGPPPGRIVASLSGPGVGAAAPLEVMEGGVVPAPSVSPSPTASPSPSLSPPSPSASPSPTLSPTPTPRTSPFFPSPSPSPTSTSSPGLSPRPSVSPRPTVTLVPSRSPTPSPRPSARPSPFVAGWLSPLRLLARVLGIASTPPPILLGPPAFVSPAVTPSRPPLPSLPASPSPTLRPTPGTSPLAVSPSVSPSLSPAISPSAALSPAPSATLSPTSGPFPSPTGGPASSPTPAVLTYVVRLSAAPTGQVQVEIMQDGTARCCGDFRAPRVVTFQAGQTEQSFTVEVVDDTEPEIHEDFVVKLNRAVSQRDGAVTVGSEQARVRILNDDVEVRIDDASAVTEGNLSVFQVVRRGALAGSADGTTLPTRSLRASVETLDHTAYATALGGLPGRPDYTPEAHELTFFGGEALLEQQSFTVRTLWDGFPEPTEKFCAVIFSTALSDAGTVVTARQGGWAVITGELGYEAVGVSACSGYAG